MPGVVVKWVGRSMYVKKFGDSRSSRSRGIRTAHFVMDDDDDERRTTGDAGQAKTPLGVVPKNRSYLESLKQ